MFFVPAWQPMYTYSKKVEDEVKVKKNILKLYLLSFFLNLNLNLNLN